MIIYKCLKNFAKWLPVNKEYSSLMDIYLYKYNHVETMNIIWWFFCDYKKSQKEKKNF